MIDIKWIRENSEEFDRLMLSRNCHYNSKDIIKLDEEKKQLVTVIQQLQKARNVKSDLIHKTKDKSSYEFERAKCDVNDINEKITQLELKLHSENKLYFYLSNIPNIPASEVPIGNESFNKEIRKWGNIKKFDFKPKQHFEIGENLKMMDFTNAVKMSGSRFVILRKDLAKLERALINFMLDVHVSDFGYEEISVPHLVKDEAMYNVGQLPKMDADSFSTEDKRLISTAEVPLINIVANNLLKEEDLPIKYVAHSLCFRSEAGSSGKDTKGMIRLHQFSKVELVNICKIEDSDKEHEKLTEHAEHILQKLELPYRVVLLSSQDMGFSARKTYDLEVWLPGQNKYREISSCSNCGDFQARRMNTRYRRKNSKESIFVHTINGSALAVGRTMIAIIENYQNPDGSISIPNILRKYMNNTKEIKID